MSLFEAPHTMVHHATVPVPYSTLCYHCIAVLVMLYELCVATVLAKVMATSSDSSYYTTVLLLKNCSLSGAYLSTSFVVVQRIFSLPAPAALFNGSKALLAQPRSWITPEGKTPNPDAAITCISTLPVTFEGFVYEGFIDRASAETLNRPKP